MCLQIPPQHLEQLMQEENIVTRPGNIVFIRSGFIKAYEALAPAAEAALPPSKGRQVISVEPSLDIARWVWKNQFAAIAGDMPGFERAPEIPGADEPLHQWLLAGWGCPIGEMFYLEELAKELARLGRHIFFVSDVPLKVSVLRASLLFFFI